MVVRYSVSDHVWFKGLGCVSVLIGDKCINLEMRDPVNNNNHLTAIALTLEDARKLADALNAAADKITQELFTDAPSS